MRVCACVCVAYCAAGRSNNNRNRKLTINASKRFLLTEVELDNAKTFLESHIHTHTHYIERHTCRHTHTQAQHLVGYVVGPLRTLVTFVFCLILFGFFLALDFFGVLIFGFNFLCFACLSFFNLHFMVFRNPLKLTHTHAERVERKRAKEAAREIDISVIEMNYTL